MHYLPKKLHIFFVWLALALVTFIAFEQLRHSDFVSYDDNEYVSENPHVKGGLSCDSIIWAFTTSRASNWHPLTWLSHMLDCQLFGASPCVHHLINILVHIINTLLLFAVLRQMTGALWRSVFVAAVFAIHPLHVESVAWISERKDVLSAFFWILTMGAYLRYVRQPGVGRYLLVLVLFALGLMAKPMLVTLPFVLLLLDYWPLNRFDADCKSADIQSRRRVFFQLVWEKVPLFVLSGVSSVITFVVQQSGGAVKKISLVPVKFRIANTFISYMAYIGKMIWPSRLAIFYPHPVDAISAWKVFAAMTAVIVITILVIRLARNQKYLPVGWLWYLGTLVPVIGLVQVGDQAMADRYTYLPLIGIFIIVAWGCDELFTKRRYGRIALAISAAAALAVLLVCTRLQVRYWQNSFTLYEHALAVTENNYMMHINYGMALRDRGQPERVIAHFREALRIKPGLLDARSNLGAILFEQGKIGEAIANLTEALRLKPDYPAGLNNLAWILATTNDARFRNPAEAIKFAQRACELTKYGRADFLDTLAVAYAAAGRFSEAVETAEKALKSAQALQQKELAGEIEDRLRLYRIGRPYIAPKP